MTNTMNTEKAVRITKTMRLDAIIAMAKGEALPDNITPDMLVEFAEKEKAQIARKNSAERKPTQKQKDNEVLEARVYEFLTMNPDTGFTCMDLIAQVPELGAFSTQKVAALANALARASRIDKNMVKGKAVFSCKA